MAYYSRLRPVIYHECGNCNVGDNIIPGNLMKGIPPTIKGRKSPQLCLICAKLKAAGKCQQGIPRGPNVEIKKGAGVETYYSRERPEIFHICQNCNVGQNIERGNLIQGRPPLLKKGRKPRLCRICARVISAGECLPGTPIPAGERIKPGPEPIIYKLER